MQRHQRLQRVAAGFGQRPDVIADLAALADVDHRLGRLALLAVQVVLVAHLLEVVDDAIRADPGCGATRTAACSARTPLTAGACRTCSPGSTNLKPPNCSATFGRRVRARALRQEAHHAEPVVPRRDVVDQLAFVRADGAEHHRPAEHLGVADLIELRAGHVQQRIAVAGLELRHQPAIEVELGIEVLASCRGSATCRRWR